MKRLLSVLILSVAGSAGIAVPAQPAGSPVIVYRDGLQHVIAYVDSRPDLFPPRKLKEPRMLTFEQKEPIWGAWKTFLDYQLALEDIHQRQTGFLRLRGAARERSFLEAHAAFLAQYRFALEWIRRAQNDPAMDVLLNEAVPEVGLSAGAYDSLKSRFLSVTRGAEFAAFEAARKSIGGKQMPELRNAIGADSEYIWKAGKGRGEILTARNAFSVLKKAGVREWMPLQSGVSEWMGDTKVLRRHRSLITQAQIREIAPRLEPGDILFERREWYLSNIGLPGYWPHAALYVGTPEERKKYFVGDDIETWLKKQGATDINDYLRSAYPEAYRGSRIPFAGDPPRILEAMSEGVIFTSLEHSAEADSLAVVRPRLSRTEKAMALARAFHYAGRPYDFNFDFLTDAELVCTELIYKAYEPATGMHGLHFRLLDILGRKATPANEMVRQFDEQFGTSAQQTDFVLFYDGHERARKAVRSTPAEFRSSWRRPKWHVLKPGDRGRD
jgi:hypothetical protein